MFPTSQLFPSFSPDITFKWHLFICWLKWQVLLLLRWEEHTIVVSFNFIRNRHFLPLLFTTHPCRWSGFPMAEPLANHRRVEGNRTAPPHDYTWLSCCHFPIMPFFPAMLRMVQYKRRNNFLLYAEVSLWLWIILIWLKTSSKANNSKIIIKQVSYTQFYSILNSIN